MTVFVARPGRDGEALAVVVMAGHPCSWRRVCVRPHGQQPAEPAGAFRSIAKHDGVFTLGVGDHCVAAAVVNHPLRGGQKPLRWWGRARCVQSPAGGRVYPLVLDLVLGDRKQPLTWVQVLIPLSGVLGRQVDKWNRVLDKQIGVLGVRSYVAHPIEEGRGLLSVRGNQRVEHLTQMLDRLVQLGAHA